AWLLARLQQAWPQHWQAILAANNERPPLTLRVNLSKLARADYLEKLTAAGLAARPHAGIDSALTLATPCAVTDLPGFAAGEVSVQDGAAQLAAVWLDARPGERVLDACAAPGGKACHVLERAAVELVAVDRDGARLERLRQNLRRLHLAAEVIAADAAEPAGWWDGRSFQRILLDAPCSGSGVIRRHPDIKLHRRPGDLERLACGQARLLAGLWPLLAPGGKLLYVTCSILPEENDDPVARFLVEHADAVPVALAADLGHARPIGVQLLPGEHELDGFYYACLQKRS
ncbi:MAG: 16S rRNA (cytosine(967)-C(5))-methyltransferase RsmB, partial [Gammaproteobacteria bacterium]|nr:16S rRNA (cytosine(967)-C(5))-methyltransferase RsmB [Gammaproteobacteria bacterium]